MLEFPEIIAEGPDVYDPDGIALDVHGDVYAVLVLKSKIVKIDPVDGHVTEILSAEDVFDEPASLAFGTGKGDRQSVFFTNFSIMEPHTGFGPAILEIDMGVPGFPLP